MKNEKVFERCELERRHKMSFSDFEKVLENIKKSVPTKKDII
jgi:hypothetical protein